MVLDTSAIIAILTGEPEQAPFIQAILSADRNRLSAATWVETSIVIESRYGAAGLYHLGRFLARAGTETVAVDAEQAHIARDAFQRYGKGRHPAALNFGDCFAYALSIAHDDPLLFKGENFTKTDITAVNWV